MVQFLSINFFSWISSIFVGFFKSSPFFCVTLYIEAKHLFKCSCSHVTDCDVSRCCCVKMIVIKLPNLVIPFGDIKADIVGGMLAGVDKMSLITPHLVKYV